MRRTRKAGFYLIDCTRALSLVSVVLGGFLVSLERMATVPASDVRDILVAEGEAAAREIARELARSGHVTVAPALLDAGRTSGPLAPFAHTTPHSGEAMPGLAYLLPQDADADGWPDLSASGEVVWSPVPRAFLCVPLADGREALVRRVLDDETILAHDVVRLVFEDFAHGDEGLPRNVVRFRITLRRVGPDGILHEVETERVVQLENGAPLP